MLRGGSWEVEFALVPGGGSLGTGDWKNRMGGRERRDGRRREGDRGVVFMYLSIREGDLMTFIA
jgi:hypothetical protein